MEIDPDPRFSLANERTYLAWLRTALALVAGGLVAAKALDFQHDVLRWIVAAPPIVAGALIATDAPRRWNTYEQAMRSQRALPVGRGIYWIASGISIYAAVVIAAVALDS